MNYPGFFCYEEYGKMGREWLTESEYKDFLYALTEYGWRRPYDISNPKIALLIRQIAVSMNATDRRYKRSIYNGKLGGRERLFTDEKLFDAIERLGTDRQKDLAEYFGCSVRTISRRINSKSYKKYRKERMKNEKS